MHTTTYVAIEKTVIIISNININIVYFSLCKFLLYILAALCSKWYINSFNFSPFKFEPTKDMANETGALSFELNNLKKLINISKSYTNNFYNQKRE